MSLTDTDEIKAVIAAVNEGIDGHLEACYCPDRGDRYEGGKRKAGKLVLCHTLECSSVPNPSLFFFVVFAGFKKRKNGRSDLPFNTYFQDLLLPWSPWSCRQYAAESVKTERARDGVTAHKPAGCNPRHTRANSMTPASQPPRCEKTGSNHLRISRR